MAGPLTGEKLRHFRHELRTPLNHIIGFAEILIDDAEEGGRPELTPQLREIRAGGTGLLDAMQSAFAGEMESLDKAQLERVADALRPRIAAVIAQCRTLERSGVYGEGEDALEQMGSILDEGIKGFA